MHLECLDLGKTRISDDGLTSLSDLRRLRILNLSDTQVSDVALEKLSQFPALEELSLDHCGQITDQGIRRLLDVTHLKWLTIPGSPQISNETQELLSQRFTVFVPAD